MSDYEELRELAKAATPGPWIRNVGWFDKSLDYIATGTHPLDEGYQDVAAVAAGHPENAAYIAKASPDVVIDLTNRVIAARYALEAFAWHATPLGTPNCPAQLVPPEGPCTCGYEETMISFGLDPYPDPK